MGFFYWLNLFGFVFLVVLGGIIRVTINSLPPIHAHEARASPPLGRPAI
jgi:hypothetical protein